MTPREHLDAARAASLSIVTPWTPGYALAAADLLEEHCGHWEVVHRGARFVFADWSVTLILAEAEPPPLDSLATGTLQWLLSEGRLSAGEESEARQILAERTRGGLHAFAEELHALLRGQA